MYLQGYAPIRQDYEDFYTRRMYYRIHVGVCICTQCFSCSPCAMWSATSRCAWQHQVLLHDAPHRFGRVLNNTAGLLEQTNCKCTRCLDRCHGALSSSRSSVRPIPQSWYSIIPCVYHLYIAAMITRSSRHCQGASPSHFPCPNGKTKLSSDRTNTQFDA